MNDIKILPLHQIEAYTGPNQIPGIRFRPARAALGVTAWGMNVLELDPNCAGYPEHDHRADGQEEVYVVLEGTIYLVANQEEMKLEKGHMVRVAPGVTRKFVTKGLGATLLAVGGTPGQAYPASSD